MKLQRLLLGNCDKDFRGELWRNGVYWECQRAGNNTVGTNTLVPASVSHEAQERWVTPAIKELFI